MDFKFKSLIELVRYFKDEKTCYDFLEAQIWHEGKPYCPHCASGHVYTRSNRSKNPAKVGVREYKCAEKGCNKNFTATVGTIFEASKLPLQTWFCAIWLCTTSSKGISSANLAKQLGITQKTAWFVLSRIREMFKETAPTMLTGEVEIDETYVGGKEANKHKNKRMPKGTTGAKGKTPMVGLSTMKRGIIGVYHQTSPKHLQRYCDEFSYRFNNRDVASNQKFATAIQAVTKARITYQNLIKTTN